MESKPSNQALFWLGARTVLPVIASVAPFSMLVGALGPASGLPADMTMAMSLIVFAGSSQIIGIQLINAGAPFVVILLTTLVINLRHVLYGFSLAPHVKHLSRGWKWLLGYLMTDAAFAVNITRYNSDGGRIPNLHWYFLGSGLALWLSWEVSTALGVLFGSQIPPEWSIDFAFPLSFIALVVPAVRSRAAVTAALVGAGMAIIFAGLPLKLGLVAAGLVGILAGMAVELKWLNKKRGAL